MIGGLLHPSIGWQEGRHRRRLLHRNWGWRLYSNRSPQWKLEQHLVLHIKENRKERKRWRSLVYLPGMWVTVLVLEPGSCERTPGEGRGGGVGGVKEKVKWMTEKLAKAQVDISRSRRWRSGGFKGQILPESIRIDWGGGRLSFRSVVLCTVIAAAPHSPPAWIKGTPPPLIRSSHPLKKKGCRLPIG